MDFNPFFSNRERVFGRVAAATQRGRTSIGSVGTIPQRVPSTRWQKQANEQEALRQLQEARKSAEKKRTSEAPATAPAPAPMVTPASSVPFKPTTPAPLFVPSPTPKTAEEPAIKDEVEESSKEDKAKKPETSAPVFTLSTTPATPPVFPTAPSTAAASTKPTHLFAFPTKSESTTEARAAAKPVVNGTRTLFAAPAVSAAPHTGAFYSFRSTLFFPTQQLISQVLSLALLQLLHRQIPQTSLRF